jgi:hypothetical protein
MSSIVGLAVEAILFGAVGIVGINLIVDAAVNGSSTVKTIVQTVVPLIIGVAALLIFLKRAGYSIEM